MKALPRFGVLAVVALGGLCVARGDAQTLETGRARLLRSGRSRAAQVQRRIDQVQQRMDYLTRALRKTLHLNSLGVHTSFAGAKLALPLSFSYGVPGRWKLLVEPVVTTAIRPAAGDRMGESGRLELVFSYLLRPESSAFPALSLAAETKISSARNHLASIGRSDYRGHLIASKHFGSLELQANMSYALAGQSFAGASMEDISRAFNASLAGEYLWRNRVKLFGEVTADRVSLPGGEGNNLLEEHPLVPALAGTLGTGVYLRSIFFLYADFSYDTNHSSAFRPGLSFKF